MGPRAALWAAAMMGAGLAAPGRSAEVGEGTEVALVGELTRAEIEQALPDWVGATVEATPDPAIAAELGRVPSPAEVSVDVFLGTWCSDSRRELTRLWRALDQTGFEPPFAIRYVGVARGLQEPADLVAGQGLMLVPTFIVRRAGRELGRVVELSENGIEADLLALLRGDRSGVLSGRDDLGPEPR